jgi:transposase-like protein
MSVLSQPHFHNVDAARARLEEIVWPQGPYCPRCGGFDRITDVRGGRAGLRRCGPCGREFTVTVGTIFERSKVPLNKWFQAAHLLASSKKGFSAHQLHRTLGVTYKTAWFMFHRLREAMKPAAGSLEPMGGEGVTVEMDETYQGRVAKPRKYSTTGKPFKGSRKGRGRANKRPVIALVERGGSARSFHVERADKHTVTKLIRENIDRESRLNTDESALYNSAALHVVKHETVTHSADEYVCGDVHSNSVEGYFSVFKRGMRGVYQHCSEKHLHRYLAEYDFRFNNRSARGVEDAMRADRLIAGIVGKRLMYRDSSSVAN